MDLVILGSSGGPQPNTRRAAPATAIVTGGRIHVIDCGNGVARQLVAAGLRLRDLVSVLVTHHHVDHNADLGALIHLAWTAGLVTPVDVYGPPPLGQMIDLLLAAGRSDIEHREHLGRPRLSSLIRSHEVASPGVIADSPQLTITAGHAEHPPMHSFAYRIDADGASVVVSGDTAPSDHVAELATGADVLVHEVYSPDHLRRLMGGTNADVDQLRTHFARAHTDAESAGRIAKQAGVAKLVLWHLIPYDVDDDEWLHQARRHFDGEIVVSRDLMRIPC
ncbi:MBL fold metallo-hydrolase [Nocardia sp. NEAU-G5]|uniref:MBL fold metallo-hydrolase n=1 Tax=Nocardia albiluteola TaxID=2842303 RepID=A0ABS6BAA2_9NOCA|nr:MBL fold metallo-hydrolase [Nocardia albiluteola]MBU3067220.1 MBL fold metallo-hydrolase [Nocardia albiluteola]